MGSASVFVRKAADALQAALALEGRAGGAGGGGGGDNDDELAAASQRYQDAIRDLTCAAAFETRGTSFTDAQRGSIAVIKARLAQLDRDTAQRRNQQQSTLPQLPAPPGSKLTRGTTQPSSDVSLDAPVLGYTAIQSVLREAVLMPQLLPQVFSGLRTPLRTLLLHGPPGTVNAPNYPTYLITLPCTEI